MNNWQPIQTAPKDGTWILIRGRNSVGHPMIPVVAAWRWDMRAGYAWYDSASLKNLTDLAAADGADWAPLPDAGTELGIVPDMPNIPPPPKPTTPNPSTKIGW